MIRDAVWFVAIGGVCFALEWAIRTLEQKTKRSDYLRENYKPREFEALQSLHKTTLGTLRFTGIVALVLGVYALIRSFF